MCFGAHGVEGSEQRDDGRFVVGRGARVDAPVVVVNGGMLRSVVRKWNGLAAVFDGVGA